VDFYFFRLKKGILKTFALRPAFFKKRQKNRSGGKTNPETLQCFKLTVASLGLRRDNHPKFSVRARNLLFAE